MHRPVLRVDRGMTVRRDLEELPAAVLAACRQHYGERLVSLAVFGSVGRGVPRPDSDVDLLIIARSAPAPYPTLDALTPGRLDAWTLLTL